MYAFVEILVILNVAGAYRDAPIDGRTNDYLYRRTNTTDSPVPSLYNCSDQDLKNFLNCYDSFLKNYDLAVIDLNGPDPRLPNFKALEENMMATPKSYAEKQVIQQNFSICYSQVSQMCLYLNTLRLITPNIEQAELYTAELSDAEMYFKSQQAADALKCYNNASLDCIPLNRYDCDHAERFLRCNLWVYDLSCSPDQKTYICDVIVKDAQRFELVNGQCSARLFDYCANKITTNGPGNGGNDSSTTVQYSSGNGGNGSNLTIRYNFTNWLILVLFFSMSMK